MWATNLRCVWGLSTPLRDASAAASRVQWNPKSRATEIRPRAVDVPRHIPTSSASPDDKVTVDCVWDQWRSKWPPRRTSPPEVDRRVSRQPAKSVSTEATSLDTRGWRLNTQTDLGFPSKYRTSLWGQNTAAVVGAAKTLGKGHEPALQPRGGLMSRARMT